MRRLVFVLVLLAACSSKPPKTGGGGTGAPPPDAAPAVGDAGATSLTAAQCDQIIDHVLAVMNAELQATRPEDEWPTEAQLAEVRQELAADFMEECRQYDRSVHDCMMAAQDSPALARCATVE